jgi:hypothetical protein
MTLPAINTQESRNPSLPGLDSLYRDIDAAGFSFVPAHVMENWLKSLNPDALADWPQFQASWENMPGDTYMADGGRYRSRRHATLSAASPVSAIVLEPQQPHYQSLDYNPLNGGLARTFAPIAQDIVLGATMQSVLKFCQQVFGRYMPEAAWHIELHQFRIEAQQGQAGKPTPEGVHRDGVNFVLVMMVKRSNISSGTTTMHDLERRTLDSFTLTAPFDSAIVNDERCLHGVTPVEQIDPALPAYRDVLVVTFRKTGTSL